MMKLQGLDPRLWHSQELPGSIMERKRIMGSNLITASTIITEISAHQKDC